MTMTLVEQIEEMRIRMHEESRGEQHLVNALGLALKRADEKLLGAIRNVAVEHEARREGIMKELHALAARLGTLPASQVPAEFAGGRAARVEELRGQSANQPQRRLASSNGKRSLSSVISAGQARARHEPQEVGAGRESRSSRTPAPET